MKKTSNGNRRLPTLTRKKQAVEPAESNCCNNQALRKAMRNVSAFYDDVLSPTGLRCTQRSVLLTVAHDRELTINQLAEKLGLERTTFSRTLGPLTRDGLIVVVPDTKDSRIRRVTLTKKGDQKLRQTFDLWRSAQEAFEQALGREEAKIFRKTLARIAVLDFHQRR